MAFFDPTNIDTEDFDALPIGEYECLISKIDLKPNRNQTGDVIKIELTVVEGKCSGRKLFDNLNWTHDNNQAQEIGRKNLARMIKSVFGEPKPINDLQELAMQTVGVRVTHRKDRDGTVRAQANYIPRNEVKSATEDTPF